MAKKTSRSRHWTKAPMTLSPNRSARPSCSRVCGGRCAGPRLPRHQLNRSSPSAMSKLIYLEGFVAGAEDKPDPLVGRLRLHFENGLVTGTGPPARLLNEETNRVGF